MEEIGIIHSVEGMTAKVSVERKAVCDHCTSGTCNISEDGVMLEALNPIGAKIGQKVRVSMKSFTYTKGAGVVYGVPALSLVLGAVVGKEFLSGRLGGIDPEGVSAIAGFGAFLVSLVFVKIWSSKAEKRTDYKPVIEEILKD